jgi:hypothetical protein
LDGPTIVILAVDVLSIRYENGKTEIINASSQPITTIPSISILKNTDMIDNSRLNTIGATFGYQGVSTLGFSVFGTVSPAKYTFFDFNLGLGFNSFAFNGRVNFNAFVPFTKGGWYAGIGIGGGYNELFGGVIAGNVTTGFLFFNWLNIGYTLQLGNFDSIVNHNASVGYAYRFKAHNTSVVSSDEAYVSHEKQKKIKEPTRDSTYRHWISGEIGFSVNVDGFMLNNGIFANLGVIEYYGTKRAWSTAQLCEASVRGCAKRPPPLGMNKRLSKIGRCTQLGTNPITGGQLYDQLSGDSQAAQLWDSQTGHCQSLRVLKEHCGIRCQSGSGERA